MRKVTVLSHGLTALDTVLVFAIMPHLENASPFCGLAGDPDEVSVEYHIITL